MTDNARQSQSLSPAKRALLQKWLRGDAASAGNVPSDTIPHVVERGQIPLSFSQQRLWFLDRLEPSNPAYAIPYCLRIQGTLHQEVLVRCINAIVLRHEALRTTFTASAGWPVQMIQPALTIQPHIHDVSTLLASEREAAAIRIVIHEACQPFDLEHDALIRATIIQLAPDDCMLLVTMHHIISDGWSTGIFWQELVTLYQALLAHVPPSLPDLPIQYADYAYWQRQWLQSEDFRKQLAYWKQRLADAPPVLAPLPDYPRPAIQTSHGATHVLHLPASLFAALKTLSQREGVTLFMTLLAAFNILLYRYTAQADILVGSPIANRTRTEVQGLIGCFLNILVLRTDLTGNPTFREALQRIRQTTVEAYNHQDLPFEKLVEEIHPTRDLSRNPLFQVLFTLQNTPMPALKLPGLTLQAVEMDRGTVQFDLSVQIWDTEHASNGTVQFEYNTDLYEPTTIERMATHFQGLLEALVVAPETTIASLPLMTAAEQTHIVQAWNNTAMPVPDGELHRLFEAQAARTPQAVALVCRAQKLSYGELDERSNQLARYLRTLGIGPDMLVGVCIDRSLEMLIALLGVLKAGGAYVPLDPTYPHERLAFMVADARLPIIVTTQRQLPDLPTCPARMVVLDTEWDVIAHESTQRLPHVTTPHNLAYVIYTSGSTGQPKGVMVEHGNIVNFFTGIDASLGYRAESANTWLAVTSISFDISVLEMFWTLVRGFQVVLYAEAEGHLLSAKSDQVKQRPIDFSLFYFASDESEAAEEKYKLLFEGAHFADTHGFTAIWTPERHFHAFGGLYPNPVITSAALAKTTARIQIRAGSVVLPLHNPIRVAEEWSMVDNFSNGRVGLSFASGWHADDFVLAPANYAQRKALLVQAIDVVRKLWRGESVAFPGGAGNQVPVHILPRPLQSELPIWLTAAGNPETFQLAGELGTGLLTHLLGQNLAELAAKIALYRASWRQHGHGPGQGHVTLMLHAFMGDDLEQVREVVREPFRAYLRSSLDLMSNFVKSLGKDVDIQDLTAEDMESVLSFAFERYFETSGLFGTPETCLALIEQLKAIEVDEIACLIDFGVDHAAVMASLQRIDALRQRANVPVEQAQAEDYSLPAQIARHTVSHMQCTPSMVKLLTTDPEARRALGTLQQLMVGGENLPVALAEQLHTLLPGNVRNMYGPTETTIWSSTALVGQGQRLVSLGYPLANTALYILDQQLQPVPMGVPGELYIGGLGVTRGYLSRADLTAAKFLPDPFYAEPGTRMYQTADLARYLSDGTIEYLGRVDRQVKLRGYRIELGEIEAALLQLSDVHDVIVVLQEEHADGKRLVGYVVPASGSLPTVNDLRHHLQHSLPTYMVPTHFVILEALPLTPNGKIDYHALPAPDNIRPLLQEAYVAPRTEQEVQLAQVWRNVLKVEQVGIYDNFFDLGGDSLLSIQMISQAAQLGLVFTPRELFQYQTIAELAPIVEYTASSTMTVPPIPTGLLPLTPFQTGLLRHNALLASETEAVVLEVQQDLAVAVWEQAVEHLWQQHDALRLQVTWQQGVWQQVYGAQEERAPFTVLDFASFPEEAQLSLLQSTVSELRMKLGLATGALWHVVYATIGASRPNLLVIVAHRLIVDDESWAMLLEDLQTTVHDLQQGVEGHLLPQTTSFQQWARQLQQMPIHAEEAVYWEQQHAQVIPLLPVDYPHGCNTFASLQVHTVTCTQEETHALSQVAKLYNMDRDELMLAALAQACAAWMDTPTLGIDLQASGRTQALADLDVAHTLGCCLYRFPVHLTIERSAPTRELLKSVKEQVRACTQYGLSYGLWHASVSNTEQVNEHRAQILYSSGKQADPSFALQGLFAPSRLALREVGSVLEERQYVLEIRGYLGSDACWQMDWRYSEHLHRRQTIEHLASTFMAMLRLIIDEERAGTASEFSPSDFPLAKISQKELDAFLHRLE